jgi:hypothetical protein
LSNISHEDQEWDAAMLGVLSRAAALGRILQRWRPDLSAHQFRGPVALLLTEDMMGEAFLAAARAACTGPLSLVPLEARHAGALVSPAGRQLASEAMHEGVLQMMQML